MNEYLEISNKSYRAKKSSFIFNSYYCYMHCKNVEDDINIIHRITNGLDCYWYCRDVQDITEVSHNIVSSKWCYYYCRYIRDDELLASRIVEELFRNQYAEWKSGL